MCRAANSSAVLFLKGLSLISEAKPEHLFQAHTTAEQQSSTNLQSACSESVTAMVPACSMLYCYQTLQRQLRSLAGANGLAICRLLKDNP
jgi:hypothetical protein